MSPAAADFSHTISSSPSNPNPSGCDGACRSHSCCFNFEDKLSGFGLSFDFSNKGSSLSGNPKPPRTRHPVKKTNGKISVSETRDFFNVSRDSVNLNRVNEARVDFVDIGESGKVGSVFGANISSFGSNENEGFALGANNSSSNSSSSNVSGSFVLGVGKSSSMSNSNHKEDGFVFGADNISSSGNSSNGNVGSVFGASVSSFGSNESEGFALGANNSSSSSSFSNVSGSFVLGVGKSSSMSNENHKEVGFVFGADKISSTANSSNGNVGSVCSPDDSSRVSTGGGASLFSPDANASALKSNIGNLSFVCGSSESFSSEKSNLRSRKSSATQVQTGASESNRADNVGFVFCGKKGDLASDSGLKKKCSSNNCYEQSGVNESGKITDKGFVSGMSGSQVNFGYGDSSSRNDLSVFGSEWSVAGRQDRPGFAFGAKQNHSRSRLGRSKTRKCTKKLKFASRHNKGTDTRNEFQKADVDGSFVFGNSRQEKPSSVDNNGTSDRTNKLDERNAENGSSSLNRPSDAMRSNFKFAIGSGSSPGSGFYKVPLLKLFDDMKGLNIENSKGCIGADKVKGVGRSSGVNTDNMYLFKSNGQTFGPDPWKESQVSNSNENVSNQNVLSQDQPVHDKNVNNTPWTSAFSSSASSHVQQNGLGSYASPTTEVVNKDKFGFTTTPLGADANSTGFKYESFSFRANINPGLREKSEFCPNSRYTRSKKLNRTSGKLRQRIKHKILNEQDQMCKEGSSPTTFNSPGCYSPMEFSPYQDTTKGVPGSAGTFMATEKEDGQFSAGTQRSNNDEGDCRAGKQYGVNSDVYQENNAKHADGLKGIRRQYRKKYKLKVGDGLNGRTAVKKSDVLFSSVQFSSNASQRSHIDKPQIQTGVASNSNCNAERWFSKQDSPEGVTNELCDQWRMRGNQAYKSGDLSKAEEYYSNGIKSVEEKNISAGLYIEPLLLCYTNRAATRMSLGRLREALEDCKLAASLDPSFLKAKLRAANCHMLLGEIQEAVDYYNNCLESGSEVCLDRRIMIEAGDGLRKAQKVSDYMRECAYLLQQRTFDAANCSLSEIVEGLSISCYSEKLLQMKGEALFLLRKYDEVIQLCEQTLHVAEKNFSAIQLANSSDYGCKTSVRFWRWCLMSKSHFHLGRLETALDLIEKLETSTSISEWSSTVNQESLNTLAATIRDLLHRKKAGNEAFQSGKHVEAVEHYTAAISSSVDSRPFAAICFCNRAAAHEALGLIADAIADCSLAIALDAEYLKAVSRRATLHEMIRDYKQAITDLQKLVSFLENQSQESTQQSDKQKGSNGSDNRELKRAQRRLSLMEDKAKQGTPMDFYLILGIKASDAESEIKKAYRKAALKHHPDKVGQFLARSDSGDDGRSWKDIIEKVHEDADRLFKMIGEAYAILSDPEKRSTYNYEEESRQFSSDSRRRTDSGRTSDHYSSPYDRGDHRSRRQSNFSSPSFGRSRSRQYCQDSWRFV